MKTDLIKLLLFAWMAGTGYLLYLMFIDIAYITDLVHLYINLIMEHRGY